MRILGDAMTSVLTVPACRREPSAGWRRFFPVMYRADPARRGAAARRGGGAYGYGNIVELRVAGRRTGRHDGPCSALLRDGNRWFLGHPNGHVRWTRNLEAAGTADLVLPLARRRSPSARTSSPPGDLRDRAILATGQHPFPGNLVYRLARAHIRAVGRVLRRASTLTSTGD